MKKVTVKVSATSANLGGGLDCLGLAYELYHTITAAESDGFSLKSNVPAPRDKTNLIYKAMNAVFTLAGCPDRNVAISSHSDIPQASGLGSSAACIVGGAVAANALCGNILSQRRMLEICARLDGHPDNVLPALLGGATAGVMTEGGGVEYVRCEPSGIYCALATPDFPLETQKARAALPDTYSRADCVYSLSRAVLAFGAFATRNTDALRAIGDKLHEPYRAPLIKGYDEVRSAFMRSGALSVCISGAGPSALAFFDKTPHDVKVPDGWTVRILPISGKPVTVEISDI